MPTNLASTVVTLGLAFLSATCVAASTRQYSADAIAARVVDADSGAPVHGVNVVAGWEVKGGMEGGNIVGWVKVMETVTDDAGKLSFPAWGPITWTKGGAIHSGSPLLIFFKSGYGRLILAQRSRSLIENAPSHMRSDWNGKAIKLTKFSGPLKDYVSNVGYLSISVDSLLSNDECNWRAIPRFLWSLQLEDERFVRSGLPRYFGSLEHLTLRYGRNCGDLKQYVEERGR